MAKLKLILVFLLALSSCKDAGTLVPVDKGNNNQIEVFRYYYDTGEYVYIARFKNVPSIVTTTWEERHGKQTIKKGNITIFENDSIQIILKN
jgi:hypothetical protein